MPKVSVILPAYNCARYLSESISSALAQTFADLELLAIDDGSTDETRDAVSRFLPDARVVYIRQDHLGLSSARNRGIEASRGDYIAFLDGDDLFLKDKIEKQVRALDRGRAIDVSYTSERYFLAGAKNESLPSPYEKFSGDLLFFLKRSNFIHISTAMVRRSSLDGIRFDPLLKSHEDWDFFLRLAAKASRFSCIREELSLIRVRKGSMTEANPVMDSSRRIVGERGKKIWKELKERRALTTRKGIQNLTRYCVLKTRAGLEGFPHSPKFNKPLPFRKAA